MGSATTLPEGKSRLSLRIDAPTDLPVGAPYYTSAGHIRSPGWPTLLRPPYRQRSPKLQECEVGLEYEPVCPSPTPFGLGLGPPDPGTINVAQETLDFRRTGFSPVFTLLMPAFALVRTPRRLTLTLQRTHDARLPTPPFGDAP